MPNTRQKVCEYMGQSGAALAIILVEVKRLSMPIDTTRREFLNEVTALDSALFSTIKYSIENIGIIGEILWVFYQRLDHFGRGG